MSDQKKIVTIVGARPQFIKAATVSNKLREHHKEILVHTGQHFDENMSKVFFDELNIPKPDYNLGISGGTHAEMTGRMLIEIEKVLMKEQPDMVLVYGDTNSTLAGSLAAVKLHIPIAHVEAGGRCGTLTNPEEVNRICTDHVSSLLFAVSEVEYKHLEEEGLKDRSYIVGNTMYDAFCYFGSMPCDLSGIVDFIGEKVVIPEHYYYMTCHRQENTYDERPLTEILSAMNSLEYPTIYPVHPRSHKLAQKVVTDNHLDNIMLIQPVGYKESIWLLKHCEKVLTDSGGLQTEAFFAEKQCVTIFEYVTWPQTMVGNRNQLSKADKNEIAEKIKIKQIIDSYYRPFGDGNAAEKVLKIINKYFKQK